MQVINLSDWLYEREVGFLGWLGHKVPGLSPGNKNYLLGSVTHSALPAADTDSEAGREEGDMVSGFG